MKTLECQVSSDFGCQCDLSNVESSGVQPACPNMPCHHGLPRLAEVFNKLEGRVGHRKAFPKRCFFGRVQQMQ